MNCASILGFLAIAGARLWCNVPTVKRAQGTMESYSLHNFSRSTIMGKYFLAWILGVPAIVLVLIYMFFH